MHSNDLPADAAPPNESDGAGLLSPLLRGNVLPLRGSGTAAAIYGMVIGELLALADDGETPLVRYPGQLGASAVFARTSVDLHGRHVGASIVLMFDQGDPDRPVVLGILQGQPGCDAGDEHLQVEVDQGGQRVIVSASEQLVLRCGKASITLTKAGKVLVEGTYVSNRSTGLNRIKGAAVQLN